jgi:uncharacterized protein YndB with AHSA1/START domain
MFDDLGELDRSGDALRLRFVRRLPHEPEKVFRALTEPEHLSAWFPTDIVGERRAGAALKFEFREGEGPIIEGTLLAYDPPRVLEYQWGEDETLRFELAPDDRGTVLTFVNTFAELGKAARDAAGWHTCLDLLGHELAGSNPPWEQSARWKQVHSRYVDGLGAEASTIGPPDSKPEYQ